MKILIMIAISFLSLLAKAQDTLVEPKQTSTQNYDLLLIAVVGLIVLIGLYFLFRRTRRR